MLAAIDAVEAANAYDPESEGALTMSGWAECWGIGMHRARRKIRVAVDAGLMKTVKCRLPDVNGNRRARERYVWVGPKK